MPTILQPGDYTVPVLPPPLTITKTILPALQTASFELLWGVGRSNPVNNPPTHGTASWTPGEHATCDFRPIVLPNGESDNLYCLRRLAPYLPDFSSMTHLSESEVYSVDKPQNVQALETDWHVQIGTRVWNPGLQLLPGKPWSVRGFDYTAKKWVALGVTFDGSLLTKGVQFGADYIISPTSLAFTSVTINGEKTPLSFVQPVTMVATNAMVFNKSVQLDATGDAKPYVLKVGQLTVSYS